MNPDDLNAVGTVIDRDPNTSKKREYTDAIHLVKPKRNEINPSANNIGLADWNSNMDKIDNYIAQILDTIGEITGGSTFLPIPASISTSGISTNAFCADVLSSTVIQSGVFYTGDVTLTDGPAGENVPATITIRKFGSFVVITADADSDEPYEWFYHYSASHSSTKWLPHGGGGGAEDKQAVDEAVLDYSDITGVTDDEKAWIDSANEAIELILDNHRKVEELYDTVLILASD